MTNTENFTILTGSCTEQLKTLADSSVQCCVTSPPYYGLRSYLKTDDPAKSAEIGAEQTPDQYVKTMVEVFREVKRVLREDGVLWLNLGDSYTSGGRKTRASDKKDGKGGREADSRPETPSELKPKDLLMIPARVAIALQADGWYLRAACPWIKRNGMPESVKDRPSQTIEQLFMLTKSERYYYDAESVRSQCSPDMQRRAEAGHTRGANGKLDDSRCDKDTLRGEHAKTIDTSKGRLRRSGDWFFESWQGMLQDEEGDPLAFVVNTKPYKGAHFAVFPPELIVPCVLSSTSRHGCCAKCGKPADSEKSICTCNSQEFLPNDFEEIGTPTGERVGEDPSLLTGRAGMNRPRGDNEGRRIITRFEQRKYAAQIKSSPDKEKMREQAGSAFDHYVRTDRAGARPVPQEFLDQWISNGWIQRVEPPKPAASTNLVPCTILDPFGGSGTTAKVSLDNGRKAVIIELNKEYIPLIYQRCGLGAPQAAPTTL